mgnify:CR=1 FL=1
MLLCHNFVIYSTKAEGNVPEVLHLTKRDRIFVPNGLSTYHGTRLRTAFVSVPGIGFEVSPAVKFLKKR